MTQTTEAPPVLMTMREVAAALRCSRTTVFELVREGRLPSAKVGRCRVIPAPAVAAFIADRTTTIAHDLDGVQR